MQTVAQTDLPILDDWDVAPLGNRQRRDLLELIELRVRRRATLITGQLPVEHRQTSVGDPHLATPSSTGPCTTPTGSP
jgi:DNA replication protein DnaC